MTLSSFRMMLFAVGVLLLAWPGDVSGFQSLTPVFSSAPKNSLFGQGTPCGSPRLILRTDDTRRTSSELALLPHVVSAVDTFYKTSPYAAAALTCGAKASAADLVAQKRQLKTREGGDDDDKIHIARNIAFLLYGAAYQGVAQEFIYNHLYPVWFGQSTQPVTVLTKVLFDLLVQTTLVTLPVAYLTKAAIFRHSPKEGMRRYWEDVTKNGLLKKYFYLWGPVQCLTFSVVPEHLRISFVAAVSFFWLIIFSTVSGRRQQQPEQEVVEQSCSLADGTTCNIDG